MGPGASKGEIIIREVNTVNELSVKPPIRVDIVGTLPSVREFLSKRIDQPDQINQKKCRIIVNREDMDIILITNEDDEYHQGKVVGCLTKHPRFESFGINSGYKWSPVELGQFIKMNRAFFTDKDANMKLVSELKNFVANINAKIEKEKNENGSFKDNYSGVVTSNLPGSFKLKIPLFKGGKPEEIEVEFYADVDGRDVRLRLYSPGAAETMEKVRDEYIDEQLEQIRVLAPDIAIIEQ